MMTSIRQAIAAALLKLGKWIEPTAGPIGKPPK